MTNPTSNFGWQMPTSTDLVTDLPADFAVFGQAVDTSMADLKGGTTGQILSKTTNTDMDFTWITNDVGDITAVTAGTGITGGGTSGAVTITNDMATTITAAGDIVIGTGSGTYDNLPIGTTAQVLTADTTVSPYKVKWATPAGGGGMTLLSTTSLSGTSTTVSSISGSYTNLMCWIQGVDYNASAILRINPNGTAGNARISGVRETTVINPSNFESSAAITGGYSGAMYALNINNYTSTSYEKAVQFYGRIGSASNINNLAGTIADTGAITSIQVTTAAGTATFTSGTIKIYGVN